MDRKDEIEFDLSKIMQEFTAQAPPAPLTGSQPAHQAWEEEAPPASVQEARERGMLIDASYGRKTKAVILMDTDHVILSAITPEALSTRWTDKQNTHYEEEEE